MLFCLFRFDRSKVETAAKETKQIVISYIPMTSVIMSGVNVNVNESE